MKVLASAVFVFLVAAYMNLLNLSRLNELLVLRGNIRLL